jgi:hypothetical protein
MRCLQCPPWCPLSFLRATVFLFMLLLCTHSKQSSVPHSLPLVTCR